MLVVFRPSRREVIRTLGRLLGGTVALAHLPACGDDQPSSSVLTAKQQALLADFADVVIPPDDQPGGAKLGAVAYVEGLLGAFYGVGAPRIYAGGPYSGRNPFPDGSYPDNNFVTFVDLDRVSLAAWQAEVTDIHDRLVQGLDDAAAMGVSDKTKLFDALPDDFRALLIDLVTEAAFAAPEYGGNPGLAGWNMIHFEGDSMPLGYSRFDGAGYVERPEAPLSTANPDDPEPMTDDTRQLIATVISVLGGRTK